MCLSGQHHPQHVKKMGSLVLQELWFMDAIHFIPCRAALRSPLKYRFSVLFRYGFLAFLVSFLSSLKTGAGV